MPDAPPIIHDLVDRFHENRSLYMNAASYNEEQTRAEFINPLFEALGWDVSNRNGYSPAYMDVVFEGTIRTEGNANAPDYTFRVGQKRMFFVEAKKPAVSINFDPEPARQIRRYSWTAKLPLGIATNFHELAVYDGRTPPKSVDKASYARLIYMRYTEFPDRWQELAGIFGREAVWKGSFDKYAQKDKGKTGTAEVDDQFLKQIEEWRSLLAHNLALRNKALSVQELNYAVQSTIDRIVFLRICEDRGIEAAGQLFGMTSGPNTYRRLVDLYYKADDRYNSGLFHFRQDKTRQESADDFTPGLNIDDKVLKDIIGGLYYPKSPYAFSVIGAEILGNVYEQFLGKVISLTAGHKALVEEKPEVKKAGGVYYTPAYIVDYIVKNTVGKLCEGKTPKQVEKLRILDPACGSGSFLINAYAWLLSWHLDYYVTHGPEKHKKEIYCVPGGGWRLATKEKKRILLNNIYGVDIDSQAVEVTKLSLLLKVLEGESAETLDNQLRLLHERALPDLSENIKCGNSLIGTDFDTTGLSDEEIRKINLFDWQTGFPDIMENGGFDAVIGNPPYIRIQTMKEWMPRAVEHYKTAYKSAAKGNYDIYVLFVERGLSLLNKHGKLGYILPHKFFNAQYGEPLRQLIASGKQLSEVVHFGDQQVFENATTYTCLLFLGKAGCNELTFTQVTDLSQWRSAGTGTTGSIPANNIGSAEWNFVVGAGSFLFEKLRAMPTTLGSVAKSMFVGQQTSADTVYLFKDHQPAKNSDTLDVRSHELEEWITIEQSILRRVVRSGDIRRYEARASAYVLFPYEVRNCAARLLTVDELSPLAGHYLNRNKALLEEREKGKFKDPEWYRFGRHQNVGMWEQPKLMVPYMITELAAYLDRSDDYYFINVTTGGYGITIDESQVTLEYCCGLLNSRLLDFYLKKVSTNFHGGYFAANKQFIELLPIRTINFDDPADKAQHDKMVKLVEKMLDLHKKLDTANIPGDKTAIQRQIDTTDREIDRLVYHLYGLTPDEIKIVEESQ